MSESEKGAPVLTIVPGNCQHIGARSEQQDAFGFSCFDDADHIGHAGFLSVVADGMGGLAMGRDASTVALRSFLEAYADKTADESVAKAMDRCLHTANRAVNKLARDAGLEGDVGTTLVAVVIYQGALYRIAAGDSRIYLLRNGELRQLTTDYNYGRVLDRMVERGEMGRAEALSHPSRPALTSYLGKSEVDEYDHPDTGKVELLPGDKVLLASDGLFGTLAEDEIVTYLAGDPQQAAESLVETTIALQRPYQDNVTVAILGYGLPPALELPSTQLKSADAIPFPVVRTKPGQVTKKQPDKPSATNSKKWIGVAGLLIVLGIAGFFAGRIFYSPPEKPESKAKEKPPQIVMPTKSENYRDAGASAPK